MHLNMIEYDLQCNHCKTLKENSISTIHTDEDISKSSSEELIRIMNDFNFIECEGCGSQGNWKVLKISI